MDVAEAPTVRNRSWAAPSASSGTVTWACSTAISDSCSAAGRAPVKSGRSAPAAAAAAIPASRARAACRTVASAAKALAEIRPVASWISGSSRNGRPSPVLKVRRRPAMVSTASLRAARAMPASTASSTSWKKAASWTASALPAVRSSTASSGTRTRSKTAVPVPVSFCPKPSQSSSSTTPSASVATTAKRRPSRPSRAAETRV